MGILVGRFRVVLPFLQIAEPIRVGVLAENISIGDGQAEFLQPFVRHGRMDLGGLQSCGETARVDKMFFGNEEARASAKRPLRRLAQASRSPAPVRPLWAEARPAWAAKCLQSRKVFAELQDIPDDQQRRAKNAAASAEPIVMGANPGHVFLARPRRTCDESALKSMRCLRHAEPSPQVRAETAVDLRQSSTSRRRPPQRVPQGRGYTEISIRDAQNVNLTISIFAVVSMRSLPTMKFNAVPRAALPPENQPAPEKKRRRHRTAVVRGNVTRRPFVLLVSNVQEANDEELLVRPGDLIEDFSRRRRGGDKGRFNNIALDHLRTGRRLLLLVFCWPARNPVQRIPCSSGSGVRRKEVNASTRASNNASRSHSICASSCPSKGAAASFGSADANSSKPR